MTTPIEATPINDEEESRLWDLSTWFDQQVAAMEGVFEPEVVARWRKLAVLVTIGIWAWRGTEPLCNLVPKDNLGQFWHELERLARKGSLNLESSVN